ncbi:hypothetical protein V494_00514 [Pseudogymnoascus sp. VKM F-4513 (FW-928)]|nr:hypothetical protein V494_00514 [Pseudogymnoascus sp. VKM F-4513 (FW-928)]
MATFRMAAPRARRAFPWTSKIQGILFGHISPHLEHLLIVPAKAPCVAARPAVLGSDDEPARNDCCGAHGDADMDTTKVTIPFYGLPVDIHLLIFEYLDPVDLTCLGIGIPFFWNIAQDIIPRRYASELGSWAGEQLICAADVNHPGPHHQYVVFYPHRIYPKEELDRMNGSEGFELHGVEIGPKGGDVHPGFLTIRVHDEFGGEPTEQILTMYNLCQEVGVTFEEDITIAAKSHRVFVKCLERCTDSTQISCIQKRKEIEVKDSPFIPKDQEWILRNLTAKEFVTAKGIALDEKFIDGPFIKGIGFADVIVTRTCFAPDLNVGLSSTAPRCFGRWSGHRFDITTWERHERITRGEEGEWRDVSKGAFEEVADAWRGEYGSGWREMVKL